MIRQGLNDDILEKKFKILRTSIMLGNIKNREEMLHTYEETAREYEEIYEDYEKYKNFINALFTKAEEVNITWKKPEDQPETDKVKEQNKEDNDDGSKVTVELNKQANTKKEGRIINQEMNIQGNMNFNI